MFKALKAFFSSDKKESLKPSEYTTVTYHEGQAYVSHDGLNLMPLPEVEETDASVTADDPGLANNDVFEDFDEPGRSGGIMAMDDPMDCTGTDHSIVDDDPIGLEPTFAMNPGTGLPMLNDFVDVGGTPFGMSDD